MFYQITYIKKQRFYDFTIRFKNAEHKIKKLAQYKEGSTNFKVKKLLDTTPSGKYVPCSKNSETFYWV